MIAIMIARFSTWNAISFPFTNCSNNNVRSCGILEIILIVKTIEIPLPTPFSVILSPIHMITVEPAVNVTTAVIIFNALYSRSSPLLPNPIAIARDSIKASATVR